MQVFRLPLLSPSARASTSTLLSETYIADICLKRVSRRELRSRQGSLQPRDKCLVSSMTSFKPRLATHPHSVKPYPPASPGCRSSQSSASHGFRNIGYLMFCHSYLWGAHRKSFFFPRHVWRAFWTEGVSWNSWDLRNTRGAQRLDRSGHQD